MGHIEVRQGHGGNESNTSRRRGQAAGKKKQRGREERFGGKGVVKRNFLEALRGGQGFVTCDRGVPTGRLLTSACVL